MVSNEKKNPSRRQFLALASLVVASGAGAGIWWSRAHSVSGATPAASPLRPLGGGARNQVTRADADRSGEGGTAVSNREHDAYLRNLHSEFKVTTDGVEAVSIRLTDVSKVRRQLVKGVPHDSYVLYFEGPADQPLADNIHRFHHEKLGDLEFFLSSYGKPGKIISYQAIFDQSA